MKRYGIVGERSKIGRYIIQYMPAGYDRVPESRILNQDLDILFLSTSTDKALNFIEQFKNKKTKIIDLSGVMKTKSYIGTKSKNDYQFLYGFDQVNKTFGDNHIANPGCSSLGILTAIYPIRNLLKPDVFVDVKFSISAMRFSSENQSVMEENIKLIHPFAHFHQSEVNYVLNECLNVKIAPSIIGVDRGISLNIFAKTNCNVNIFDELERFYKNHSEVIVSKTPVDLIRAAFKNKAYVYVKQDEDTVLINVTFDNLIYGGAANAVKVALSN